MFEIELIEEKEGEPIKELGPHTFLSIPREQETIYLRAEDAFFHIVAVWHTPAAEVDGERFDASVSIYCQRSEEK